DKIKEFLSNKIRSNLRNGTAVSKTSAKNAVSEAVGSLKSSQYADDLATAVGGNVEDITKQAFAETSPGATGLKGGVKPGERIKNFLKSLAKPGFWSRILKSVGCGVLANLAGLQAQQWVLNMQLGDLRAEAQAGQSFNFAGPLSNYEGVEVFRKFKPYHITITMDDKGITHVSIEEVKEEDIAKMGEAIVKKTAEYWKAEDCKKQLEQGIDELIGCLMPDPEVKGVTQAQVLAYYDHNPKIAAECISDQANKLDEALLMSVLFTSPENIDGCCDGDQCIQKDWYSQKFTPEEQEQAIECAASKLRKAMLSGSAEPGEAMPAESAGETVKQLAKEKFVDDKDALNQYAAEVVATYKVWQKFNFCDDTGTTAETGKSDSGTKPPEAPDKSGQDAGRKGGT
ncbi:MAG: hypothetical protein NT067_07445, partial [Candidatus Diapherotrites archaeon]|nr:hypothetical protein [Candidatus Diapherotrites archaeon]